MQILGRELRAVNIDLDAAPVMDVDTNPANPVIGEPPSLALMCTALLEGWPGYTLEGWPWFTRHPIGRAGDESCPLISLTQRHVTTEDFNSAPTP